MYRPTFSTAAIRSKWHLADIFNKNFFYVLMFLNFGLLIVAYFIQSVVIHNSLFPGGLTGWAAAIHYVTDWPISYVLFTFNIPIMIIGLKIFDLRYIIISIAGMTLLSFWLEFWSGTPKLEIESKLLSGIFAAIVTGFGTGLYMRVNGSAGGLDVITAIIKRKFSIPMGTASSMFNFINVCLAAIIYDINIAIYSAIYIYIFGIVVNKVIVGFSQRKAILIITTHPEEITYGITRKLDRGVTYLKGLGSFSKSSTRIVFTIINMVEVGRLKEIIHEVDPHALICVLDTAEVIGKKFLTWENQGYTK